MLENVLKFRVKHNNTEESGTTHNTAKYIKAAIIFSSNLPIVIIADWYKSGSENFLELLSS